MDVIDASSSTVMNVLIDHSKIENKILMEDAAAARKVMFESHRPVAKECFLPDGTRLFVQ